MRVAVYGGSFNPPHVGHGLVAAWLGWTRQVDAVWLIPTYVHAFGKDLAPYETRLAMCRALARDVGPWVEVHDVESERDGKSFTIDTLNLLAERHPAHRFRLVVGADVLPELPKWKAWDQIAARFDPLVVGRQGFDGPPEVPQFPGISSTEIRRRLASGQDVSALVPASVLALAGGLYG